MWCGRVAVSFLLSGLASAAWINNISNRDLCVNTPLRVRGCGRPHLFELELPEEPASPWTFKPQCINSTFGSPQLCVFTSHEFANGRGISIITTPSTAAAIQNLTSFTQSGNLTKAGEMAVPPFEVRDLPGRGKGGIANTTLHRGDRLLAATPAILVDMRVNRFLNVMDGIMLETIAVRQLPPQANEMFWELHNQPTTNSVRDRITVNAFAVEVAGWQFSGVVLETSRFNHDCRPNSAYYFDEKTLTHYTHASTEINPGTEISLTYISPLAPQQHRQNTLRVSWGFKCTCSQCSMHPKMIKHSDTRIEHINNMTRLLYGWHERWTARLDLTDAAAVAAADTKKPVVKDEQQAKKHEEAQQKAMDKIPVISNVEAIATAETVISLYQQERLVVYSSDAHLIAALANCAEGRRTEAIKHAQLALETGLVHEGLDDELHVDVVKLGVDPTKEPCWLKKEAGSSLSDVGEVAESS